MPKLQMFEYFISKCSNVNFQASSQPQFNICSTYKPSKHSKLRPSPTLRSTIVIENILLQYCPNATLHSLKCMKLCIIKMWCGTCFNCESSSKLEAQILTIKTGATPMFQCNSTCVSECDIVLGGTVFQSSTVYHPFGIFNSMLQMIITHLYYPAGEEQLQSCL